MPNPDQGNFLVQLGSTSGMSGGHLQLNFPNQGDPANGRCPLDLRAITWPEGRRIDITWRNPGDITRIVIKRSQTAHSAFIEDEAEIIYNGPAIDHFIDGNPLTTTIGKADRVQQPPNLEVGIPNTGADLEEDKFYYYTVYATAAQDPIGILDFGGQATEDCQVTGLSILDYIDLSGRFGGEYFYKLFDQITREEDAEQARAEGRSTGYLRDVSRFMQGAFNLYRGYTTALLKLGDPSETPAGNVGFAVNQANTLKAWVRTLGFPPERFVLDVNVLRRIAQSAIFFFKEKGTCEGIRDLVKIITLWDAECDEIADLSQGFFLETWDGTSICTPYSFPLSLVSISPGEVFVPGGILTPDQLNGGLFIDRMGDVFIIESNTADTITFEDSTATPVAEDLVTVSGVLGTVATITANDGHIINDGEYDGLQFLDSANQLFEVVATDGTASTITLDAAGAALGIGGIAPVYFVGAAFANRDPQFVFQTYYNGIHTFLWEATKDLSLVEDFDLLYTGGSVFGVPFQPQDVIITIDQGVASFIGEVDTIVDNLDGTATLTDTSANFGFNDTLIGYWLNPNRNQDEIWEIVANTATTITVRMPNTSINPTVISEPASDYFILNRIRAARYKQITRLIELALPAGSTAFFYFE